MKKLYTPVDESELVFLKSLFEAEGVPFYVLNDNFGSLYSGVYMNYFNAKTIMVPQEFYEESRALILSVKADAVFEDERGTANKGDPGNSNFLEALLEFVSFKWLYKRREKTMRAGTAVISKNEISALTVNGILNIMPVAGFI